MTEDERKQLEDLHRYFMAEPLPGKKSRAQEIDDLLTAARAGKFTARAVLWVMGFIAAVGAAWAAIRSGIGQ